MNGEIDLNIDMHAFYNDMRQKTFKVTYIALWIVSVANFLWIYFDYYQANDVWHYFALFRIVYSGIGFITLVFLSFERYRRYIYVAWYLLTLLMNIGIVFMLPHVKAHLLSYVMGYALTLLMASVVVLWRPLYFYTICIVSCISIITAYQIFPTTLPPQKDIYSILIYIFSIMLICVVNVNHRYLAAKKDFILQANLTNAIQIKDKFFSIIAHDLRSPFNSIVGFSGVLAKQVKEMKYERIEEFARIIERSSNHAYDLLMNLMEWSLSQTGSMKFNPEYFEITSFINETVLLYKEIAGQKTISIIERLPANVTVWADKSMISTILRNLISNAIKFTHSGGEVIISASENEKSLSVSVSDNGVGISKDNIHKIFRIDESYTTSGTKKEKGTGLGLILCHEFIEKHGGKIWVESEEGKGSVFHFTIPLSKTMEV